MRGNRIAATRSHCAPSGGCGCPTDAVGLHRHRVLGVEPQPVVVRDDAVGGPAGQVLQLRQPGRQQRRVAAKLVDQKARDERLVLRFEHRHRAEQVGQQPAAVDVADQDDGQMRGPRQPHVGQIGCPQVDLGGRAGTLTDDGVEFASQRGQFVGHHVGEPVAVLEVVGGADRTGDSPAHHQLRGAVAAGLEQYRVEPDARRQPRGARLHGLRPADLSAFDGDRRVVGHVLRLERRDAMPLRASSRHRPATTIDFPASEVVPAISSAPLTGHPFPPSRRKMSHLLRRVGDICVCSRKKSHGSWVRISAPSSVTTRVCSNCAVHLRSLVTTVQSSSQIS